MLCTKRLRKFTTGGNPIKSSLSKISLKAAVLKLGVATLLGVAKLLKRVAIYQNLEFFDNMT
jgi:hypothetical protein